MVECARHINLVRSPAENSDLLLERVMSGCSYSQKSLLQKVYRLLQNEHLARLVMTNVRGERERTLRQGRKRKRVGEGEKAKGKKEEGVGWEVGGRERDGKVKRILTCNIYRWIMSR